MEQRRCHSLINVKNSFWRGLALPDWQRQPTNFYIIIIVLMLIYTCRSQGNNYACIINDSFHTHVRFRVFEANQLQKHHCYLTSIYYRCRTSPQDFLYPFLVLFLFTHSVQKSWNSVEFGIVGGSCQVFWQQKVRERVASQICGLYCGRVLEYVSAFKNISTCTCQYVFHHPNPSPPTYVPTSPSLVLFLHLPDYAQNPWGESIQ